MCVIASFIIDYKPFVFIRFHNVNITNELFNEYKVEYLNILLNCKKNKEKVYMIIDINEFNSLPIPYLLQQAQFNKKIFHLNQKYLHAAYIYCKSKIFKQIISMYFLVEKNAVPLRICRSITKLNTSIKNHFNIDFDCHVFCSTLSQNENTTSNNDTFIDTQIHTENIQQILDYSKSLNNNEDLDINEENIHNL